MKKSDKRINLPPSPVRLRRLAPFALVLASAAAAVGAYLQALGYPFISDDGMYIANNSKLAGLQFADLWRLLIEPYNAAPEFLPLRDFSYWIDIKLFGLNPAALRLHNILLYLLCLPLAYAATSELWRYFRPADIAGAPWAAAAVTALFALHPALVESVVWISGRKYVLPNLLSMLAIWFALRARREQGLSAPHAAAALVAFVAVMLSKSSYVAVAPVIAMLWMMFWLDIPATGRRRPQLLWPLAILFLAAIQFLIFIAASGATEATGLTKATGMPFYFGVEAVTRSLAVLGWLARLAVSPESRHFFYPVFDDPYLSFRIALGVAVLAAAIASAVMLPRKRSLEGFALVAFLLFCMPYMQLVPYLSPSLAQDRYLSLAAWPAVLLLVALSWRLKPASRAALLLVIALPWGFQTMERPRDWRSFEALVDTDLRAYPGYYMPVMFKASDQLLHQGLIREAIVTANRITIPEFRDVMIGLIEANYAVADANATGKPQEAMVLLWKLWLDHKQSPAQAKWNTPMEFIWLWKKDFFVIYWNRLAEFFPDDVSVRYNAGLWMLSVRMYDNAAAHLLAATGPQRLPEPVRGVAFKSLGLALLNSGRAAEAEAPLRAALEQPQPDLGAYCPLSSVYKQAKRHEEAARAEAECLKRAPGEEMAQ